MEPLPPVKEVEYRCIIGKLFDELAGMEFTTFSFETAKEFSNFRYEIAVRYRISEGRLEFRVLGMTATRTMMPAYGTARSVLKLPHLPFGIYTIVMIKSDATENEFTLELAKKGFQILQPVPRKRFIDLVIENNARLPGGKILSTVTKTPPAPLIPRTIQKRQPPPPTPEELAIMESLRPETPEERDAREERELFGEGKSRKSKAVPAEDPIEEAKPAKAAKSQAVKTPAAKPAAKVPAKKAAPKAEKKPAVHKAPAKHTTKPAPKAAAKKPAKAKPAAKTPKHAAKSANHKKPAPAKKAKPAKGKKK
jgi:hypothetical protein